MKKIYNINYIYIFISIFLKLREQQEKIEKKKINFEQYIEVNIIIIENIIDINIIICDFYLNGYIWNKLFKNYRKQDHSIIH